MLARYKISLIWVSGMRREFIRRDEGWTLMEALLSVVLISVVFLGFTVSLLAMREVFTRAWATRTIEQYAINFAEALRESLRGSTLIQKNQNQFGLGSFRLSIPEYHFDEMPFRIVDRDFNFSVSPTLGILLGEANVAAQPYDLSFAESGWSEAHRFSVSAFSYEEWNEAFRPSYFNDSMGKIKFTIRYERPRRLETPGGLFGTSYVIEKTYTITHFMKNFLDQPD